MPPRPIEEYQVGWMCALPKELTAARAMLDEEHDPYTSQGPHDNNSYVLGRIHGHNVVMACLPAGVYGTVSAAVFASGIQPRDSVTVMIRACVTRPRCAHYPQQRQVIIDSEQIDVK